MTAALRGQPEPPNPVELENLAVMLRAAAAAIQADKFALRRRRHATRRLEEHVSSRTDAK
jgi:hypothetical protein